MHRIVSSYSTALASSSHVSTHKSPNRCAKSNVTTSLSLPKFGVPTPVTGSHPLVALNPGVPHPGLFPVVISLNARGSSASIAYTSGFKNPSGGRPLDSRAELSSETMPANVGEDADVPPMRAGRPVRKMRRKSPCAATSGMAFVVLC